MMEMFEYLSQESLNRCKGNDYIVVKGVNEWSQIE